MNYTDVVRHITNELGDAAEKVYWEEGVVHAKLKQGVDVDISKLQLLVQEFPLPHPIIKLGLGHVPGVVFLYFEFVSGDA